MKRRDFLKTLGATTAALGAGQLLSGCDRARKRPGGKRVIVVAAEGLDAATMERLIAAGRLPHLASLAKTGTFHPLATTTPAEPETAWATFATGLDPAEHGIFSRFGRDPQTYRPCLNDARRESARFLGERVVWPARFASNLCGESFWHRAARDVTALALWAPASFPARGEDNLLALSGWGTPDAFLSPGIYHYFASRGAVDDRVTPSGGVWRKVIREGKNAKTFITPPAEVGGPAVAITFTPLSPFVLRIAVGGVTHDVATKTFSPSFTFPLGRGPLGRYRGAGRFYVLGASPEILVYLTPLDLDPRDDCIPTSSPASFGRGLALDGPFSTRGRVADIAALHDGAVGNDVYASQFVSSQDEKRRIGLYAYERFAAELTLFGSNGLGDIARIFWRYFDEGHPNYNGERFFSFADIFEHAYVELDATVGKFITSPAAADARVLVVSPYGCKPTRRIFDINCWLRQEGYLKTSGAGPATNAESVLPDLTLLHGQYRPAVDWPATKAWGQGYGQIYVNAKGRERHGRVAAGDAPPLKANLRARLLDLRDDGRRPVAAVHDCDELFRGPRRPFAPDLLVTLNAGYRFADHNVLGAAGPDLFADNRGFISGETAGLDADAVPGVLITNLKLKTKPAGLRDVGPTVLDVLDVG